MAVLTLDLAGNILNIVFLSFGIFYIYSYARCKLSYWKRRGVPSPPANLIFGNFKDAVFLRTSPNKILAQVYDYNKHSPYIGFYVLHKPCLLIKSPELLEAILIRDFDVFSDRHFIGHAKRDIDTFSTHNPESKYLRCEMSLASKSEKLNKVIPLMIKTAKAMLEYIEIQPAEENSLKPMKMKVTSSKYTTDIISLLVFGVQTNSFQIPEPKLTRDCRISNTIIRGVLDLFAILFFPEPSETLKTPVLGKSEHFFRDVFWNSVYAQKRVGTKPGDFFDSLIHLKTGDQYFKFSEDYLFAQAAIFFMAGQETTSLTMAFTLLELAKQPEIQENARSEIKKLFEKHGITQVAFQEMKYLNQVVSETLRMHPPAPILNRVALKDYQIPGSDVIIEKGTSIFVPLLGLHMDPKYYSEPLKYDPDRFSEDRKKFIPPLTYMPFGEGPRHCIGQEFGLLQTTVGLSMILSEYEVSLNPNFENVINPRGLLLQSLNDIRLYLKKINPKNSDT